MPVLRLPVLLIAVAIAAPVAAQPSAGAVVSAWRSHQAEALRAAGRVEADETMSRRIDGPRGAVRLDTRGTLALDVGADRAGHREGPRGGRRGLARTVSSASVDDRPVAPERLAELEHRLGRAFGPGFDDASRAPRLVPPALARGTAMRLAPDDVDGRPAWRVSLTHADGPPEARPFGGPPPGRRPPQGPAQPDRTEAWFTRSADAPRLLRVVTTGERPGGGTLRRTVDFAPVGGLDLPVAARSALRVSQRRRLRAYTTAITVEARYDGYRLGRR